VELLLLVVRLLLLEKRPPREVRHLPTIRSVVVARWTEVARWTRLLIPSVEAAMPLPLQTLHPTHSAEEAEEAVPWKRSLPMQHPIRFSNPFARISHLSDL
jgi:hypothetical protein